MMAGIICYSLSERCHRTLPVYEVKIITLDLICATEA